MSDGSAGSTGEVVERDEGSIPQAADSSYTTTASEQPDTGSNVGECDTDSTSVPHDTNNADIPRVALLKKELFQNILRVTVGNTTVNGLIDTGASISVISCNFISKLKPSLVKYLQSDISKIYGVGNVAHDVTEKVQLSLRVGDQKLTQCFYILRQNQYDIILGMDFIRQHQVKMDFSFSDPEITIAGQKHYLQPPQTRSMLAKTLSAVTIMGYSAMDVPVKLSKSLKTQLMLLEPVSSLTRYAPGLSVADSLVSSQVTYCRIANTTDTPISLPDNCVVAIARITTLALLNNQNFMLNVLMTKDPNYEIGELVWLHNPRVPVGLSKKLRPQWCGPFRICEANDNHTYHLRDAVTHDVSDTLIHASWLKPATLHDESALRNHHRTMQQHGAPVPAQAPDAQPPPNQNVEDEVEDAPGQPDEPPAKVEKVVNLCKNNKGRWYQVKFEGIPGTKWYLEGFIDIPNELIEECLKKKTWQGKTRKRKQH